MLPFGECYRDGAPVKRAAPTNRRRWTFTVWTLAPMDACCRPNIKPVVCNISSPKAQRSATFPSPRRQRLAGMSVLAIEAWPRKSWISRVSVPSLASA